MPFIQVNILQGRAPHEVRDLITAVTHAVTGALAVRSESVRVIVTEVPAANWASGDVTLEEKARAAVGGIG